jgi:hypothetical protein
LYTLDGRIRFELALAPEVEEGFRTKKLREIVLARRVDGVFELAFSFSDAGDTQLELADAAATGEIPEYVMVEETV